MYGYSSCFLSHALHDPLIIDSKFRIEEIKKDKEHIQQLHNSEQVEKYAREKYYMKKDSEDIYIIEFEGDSITKNAPN